jgi:phosphate-selective porin
VLEIFTDRVSTGSRTDSALVGFIWQPNDALAFDFGLRKARTDEQKVTEIRAGLTWSLPVNHAR